jgi:predicted ferric reductase
MTHIKLGFVGLLAALIGLWLLADPLAAPPEGFFALRTSSIYGTGIVGIGVMSVALMLAARPVFVEPWLGGLDKMYRLHKWLGIAGLAMAVLHWLATQAPKWGVALGWLERPARQHGPEPAAAVFQFFNNQRGLAEGVGEWACYAAVALIALALVKRFPYRLFFKTHRLLAVAYLALVFHAVVLMKFSFWGKAVGPVLALLMLGGSVAALVILLGRVGLARRAVGVVENVTRHADLQVLEVAARLQSRWAGHEAGQFVFVTFDEAEGPHPFTVSSAWKGDGRLLFFIKALGDYTKALPARLKPGDLMKVEGPYGQFNFGGDKPRQIWVGGGIGITPFIARMKSLAQAPDGKEIDLFHTSQILDEAAFALLATDALAAHVRLHLMVDARDGRLDGARICREVPDWKSGEVWFCGPAGFGRALQRDLGARGLAEADFHQELFAMR